MDKSHICHLDFLIRRLVWRQPLGHLQLEHCIQYALAHQWPTDLDTRSCLQEARVTRSCSLSVRHTELLGILE